MARVTDAEVKVFGPDDIPDTLDTTPFIDYANRYIANVGSVYPDFDAQSEDIKTDIELQLSLHFTILKTKWAKTEKADVVGASYQEKNDLGLDLTHYGQAAKLADLSGTLAIIDENNKNGVSSSLSFDYLGTDCHCEDPTRGSCFIY